MKRFLLAALAALAMTAATAQENSTGTELWRSDFNVDMSERCLVLSSLDYRTVSVFDSSGELVQRVNLRRAARHQTSALVFVCFDGWEDGRYTVLLENGKVRNSADMVKDRDRVIIITEG